MQERRRLEDKKSADPVPEALDDRNSARKAMMYICTSLSMHLTRYRRRRDAFFALFSISHHQLVQQET